MRTECKFAIFNYESVDADLVDDIISYLDERAESIFEFFKVAIPKNKIEINIIPTKQEFDKIYELTLNQEAKAWVIGYYHTRLKTINYLSLHDYKNTAHSFKDEEFLNRKEHYKKTILHEFVHYVNNLYTTQNNCENTEKYLSEGLAIYLSGQKSGENLSFDYKLEDILNNEVGYNAYYLLTKFLLENYSKELVFDLIKNKNKARSFLESELYKKLK